MTLATPGDTNWRGPMTLAIGWTQDDDGNTEMRPHEHGDWHCRVAPERAYRDSWGQEELRP